MISLLKSLKLPGSILRIEVIDDKIYILDNKFILLIYSNETFSLIDKHFLLDSQNDKHIYENTLAISKNLDFYHSFTKSTSGVIFNIHKDEVKQSLAIELHHRDVSYALFSNNSKLLLIGGEDGYSCFYDLEFKRSCFSLEARSDFISSAVFSNSDQLVCIGAYDKAIKIHDINEHKTIAEIKLSDTPEGLIFSDNESKILGITRDRKLFSYLIKEDTLTYASMLFAQWPTSIVKVSSNHLLVGTKGDILYIFNINDLSLVRRFQVDNFGVKTLHMHQNNLYIGYSNGELKIININFLYNEFEVNLKENKFAKATSLMRENIFLMTKDITSKYDKIWEQVLNIAKNTLLLKDLEKAEKIVRPFFWDKRKKDQFMALQVNIADIKHFESLVEQGSHVVAFKFADEKEHLKTLKSYELIEIEFYKKFQLAKALFAKDTQKDIQRAKDIIKPYLQIHSKKDLISSLIFNYKIFSRSLRLIKSRNFKVYFRLVQNNEFLKDENLYSKIVDIGNQTYSNLLALEQQGNYDKALQLANNLQDFTPFSDKVFDIQDIIQSKINLLNLIKTNNVKQIYEAISKSDELQLTSAFIEYHKIFEAKKDEAYEFANQGKSLQVKETLQDHLQIEYLLNSIAMIFKLSYLVEIEIAMQNTPQNVHIIATLDRYSILFGIDSQLHLLSKRLHFDHLVPDYPANSIGYETNNFFDAVVVFSK